MEIHKKVRGSVFSTEHAVKEYHIMMKTTLPTGAAACIVKSDVPLLNIDSGSVTIKKTTSFLRAYKHLVCCGLLHRDMLDHFKLCSKTKKDLDKAISLFEQETTKKLKVIKKYTNHAVFENPEIVGDNWRRADRWEDIQDIMKRTPSELIIFEENIDTPWNKELIKIID